MATEIERKFLVVGEAWRAAASVRIAMRQGYLTRDGQSSVRVRITDAEARLNLKAAVVGTTRLEYDWPIARAEAEEILDQLCLRPLIEKVRHIVLVGGKRWEVDEFLGENAGLVVAELELSAADEAFEPPAWLGREVTEQQRYYNQALALRPFAAWSAAERDGR
jgi:adenylate cyclase